MNWLQKRFHRHKWIKTKEEHVCASYSGGLFGKPSKSDGLLVLKECKCGEEKAEFITAEDRDEINVEYAKQILS